MSTDHDAGAPSGQPDDGSLARTVVPASHRRDDGTPSRIGRVILPLALAVVSVVALFAAWAHLVGERGDSAAAGQPSTSASGKPAVPSLGASPSPQETESVEPEPSTSPTSASPTPSPSPTRTSIPVDRTVPVTVLNGTRRTGLAATVAADLRSKGWTIVSIGNWRGTGVDTTTVFVEGEQDAAATMRRDLRAADATRTPIGAMKDGRITVVIMDDYPRR